MDDMYKSYFSSLQESKKNSDSDFFFTLNEGNFEERGIFFAIWKLPIFIVDPGSVI